MRILLSIPAALLAWTAAAPAKPFETQAQIEARTGGRICNGAETSDYTIMGYTLGDLNVWVLYIEGVSGGELYARNGPMPDMEVASFLEMNKGQSSWQVEKIEGTNKQMSAKAWSRKDGKLYALLGSQGSQSFFMIGTKKAERIMGDPKRIEERLMPRDRIQ